MNSRTKGQTVMTWRRDRAGRQTSTDGRYAVECDGLPRSQNIDPSAPGEDDGYAGGEWAAVIVEGDETLDWYPTMREAKACCQRHAKRAPLGT